MSAPHSSGRSGAEISAELAEMRRTYAVLQRRSVELTEVWARARVRRAQLRRERIKLSGDMQLRRAATGRSEGRAAAAILEAALTVSRVSLPQLWLDFVALGGTATCGELGQMIGGTKPLSRIDHDRIALALNERMEDAGLGRPVAYWDGRR